MRRVAIVGCSGGGKSALARALAAKTGLPLVHIDQEYWQPGWLEPPLEQWRGRHAELIAAPGHGARLTGKNRSRFRALCLVFRARYQAEHHGRPERLRCRAFRVFRRRATLAWASFQRSGS